MISGDMVDSGGGGGGGGGGETGPHSLVWRPKREGGLEDD